jgi:hypothetical protein
VEGLSRDGDHTGIYTLRELDMEFDVEISRLMMPKRGHALVTNYFHIT